MSKKNDIRLLRVNYLRGPNMWTYRPVLEVWLDLGELEDHPSHLLPGFNDRLTAALPNLIEHHCGVGERGGFIERLRDGTWMGHVLEHIVIELLNLSGMPTGFGQTRSTSQRGVYRMVFRARDEQVARAALAEGHALIMAVINDEPFDVPAATARVRDKLDDCYLGPSTAAIVAAATDRRIPHIRLNDGNLVQLGHGARQRRIWTAETDMTSAIAEGIAGDKDLTKTLLKAVGVPVPAGEEVKSTAQAWRAVGLPRTSGAAKSSSPATATTAEASRWTSPTRPTARPPSSWPTRKARQCWWRATSPATSTACWSSAARSSRPRAARRPGCTATASRPAASSTSMISPGC